MNTLALRDLDDELASSGNSLLSMVMMLAMSLGVAIAGGLLGAFGGTAVDRDTPRARGVPLELRVRRPGDDGVGGDLRAARADASHSRIDRSEGGRRVRIAKGAERGGTGVQASLFRALGVLAGVEEGLELNVLGLTFGIDPNDLRQAAARRARRVRRPTASMLPAGS